MTARQSDAPERPLPEPVSLEHALVVRAQRGDSRAFAQLFERYAPAVRRFLKDLLRDDAAADESVQETFVRAHARLPSLREAEKLLSWLFGIARLVAWEQLRIRRRIDPTSSADLSLARDPRPNPEGAVLSEEADAHLATALGLLSEERRAALLLRIDHGLGYGEIGDLMGWSLPKVKNEIHRARLQLRSRLQDYLEVPHD